MTSPTRRTHPGRASALLFFAISVSTITVAAVLAAARFPGGFDWVYTVMSALASRKHNPDGGVWFAAGLALSQALLWPVLRWIRDGVPPQDRLGRTGSRLLFVGVVFGVLVGLERTAFHSLSQHVRKAHEVLALLCFLHLYTGVLLVQIGRVRTFAAGRWAIGIVVAPLVAIGVNQLVLYFDQRDLGWVDTEWRAMGIPFWMSFAFWQWLAAGMLWFGIGHLAATRPPPAEAADVQPARRVPSRSR
ncbi:hypothetical protein [Congregicoccus parvus]|uniref:hypothetical protein n=1 Tax=Congregicoccus parvus TaxID=3081749 RepID=UPI003FA55F58